MGWQKSLTVLLVVGAAGTTMGMSWHLYYENRGLQKRVDELQRARDYPYVINGFRPEIAEQTILMDEYSFIPRSGSDPDGQILVLVASDKCRFCEATLASWVRLWQSTRWKATDEVWLVLYNEGELFRKLVMEMKSKGTVNVRLLKVRDPMIFMMRTGILEVPSSLILDRWQAVRLFYAGRLHAKEESVFADALNRKIAIDSSRVFLKPTEVSTQSPIR